MKEINLLKAFRVDENTVKALYYHNSRHQEFLVEWNNIHPETGEIVNYSLQANCLSGSDNLSNIVNDCVKLGESDDNKYLNLYLELRDTFDSNDCKSIC